MGGKIGSTADVLDAQQKEQKVSVEWHHADLAYN